MTTNNNLIKEVTTTKGYKLKFNTGLFINNEFVEGPRKLDTINPATGEKIATVEAADLDTIEQVVAIADEAYRTVWKVMPAKERGKLLFKLAELIDRDAEELAQLETLDSGKGITFSRAFDVQQISDSIRYYAGWADKIQGKVIDIDGALAYTRHEPLGVCVGIIPWNFPLMMLGWKMGPSLACGNTIIIKTSSMTPLSALKVAALVKEAGFPPGVVTIITGSGGIIGEALARHMKVAKISFTGSTGVGHSIMKGAAESNLKKVTLELGGKSASIIFDDADLDDAVKWSHKGIFFNDGQVCCAGSRIYVQDTVYDKFIQKLKDYTAKTVVGDPADDGTFLGPQISQKQYNTTMKYIDLGKKEGATVVAGGNRWGDKGYFIEPTIFSDCTEDMTIVKEEIFGPVVAVSKFHTLDEAVEKANNSCYGLAAAVFTKDSARSIDVANRLEAGTVWVNCYNELDYNTPFGGYHMSGQGRENGEYALDMYTQVKTIKINVRRKA